MAVAKRRRSTPLALLSGFLYEGGVPTLDRQTSMDTRITRRFAALKAENRAGLVTFTMAGDPDGPASLDILRALPAAGADLIACVRLQPA